MNKLSLPFFSTHRTTSRFLSFLFRRWLTIWAEYRKNWSSDWRRSCCAKSAWRRHWTPHKRSRSRRRRPPLPRWRPGWLPLQPLSRLRAERDDRQRPGVPQPKGTRRYYGQKGQRCEPALVWSERRTAEFFYVYIIFCKSCVTSTWIEFAKHYNK